MILQGKFSQEFLDRIPDLEKELVSGGLDSDDFTIAKYSRSDILVARAMGYSYTVTVNGEEFTVSMPNDMEFFEYFHNICFPTAENKPAENIFVQENNHKLRGLISRLSQWLEDEPFKEQ